MPNRLCPICQFPYKLLETNLRRIVGEKRLTTASEEEVLRVTGYPRGAVSPFGLARPLPILADPGIFKPKEISIGSGVRGTTVILSSFDLRRALPDFELVNLQRGGRGG